MAITRDKQILVGLVVLAGLGAAAYFQQKKDADVGVASKGSADLPTLSGPEDVDKISITNGAKGEFVLAKEGDKWMLTKPVHALANQNNVKQLIDNLKELKTTEAVAPTATDELKKTYELDPEHAVHVVTWKGADQKVDDTFGKNGSRGEMAMAGDKPGIYSVKGFSISLYNREQKGWRDTEIFKFDDGNATSVTISNANGEFSFTKGDKWAATFKGQPIDRYDETKITQLLSAYKMLNADDFGDGKLPLETGLDKPLATVTIALKDNAGKYTLHVGKTASGTSSFAQKEGDATIFSITKAAADWAEADPSKFQKVADAGAATASAKTPPRPGAPGMPPGMPPGHPPVPPH
jgi:hypothetical protein